MKNINNIYCVGRNYRAHAKELQNAVPKEPLFFMKPTHAAVFLGTENVLTLPKEQGSVHFELELVIRLKRAYEPGLFLEEVIDSIALGLDFTLRDVQNSAKEDGLPWLKAKGFPNSAALTAERSFRQQDWSELSFKLLKNGVVQQVGFTADMIFDLPTLLGFCQKHFGLDKDDLIFTGTPAGVGAVSSGDQLQLILDETVLADVTIA